MFFDLILESKYKKLDIKSLRLMQEIYKLDQIHNAEVKFKYQMLALSLKDTAIFDHVTKFVTSAGRMKFVRPLYRSLNACGDGGRALAMETFKNNRSFYHPICANMVAKDLGV
jgi:Leukotriene A4 hydrolase, C-terminal